MSNNNSNIRLSGKEKIELLSNLATMLGAGIPILEVIESLLEEAKGNSKIILTTIKEDLHAGNFIYTSLARFPKSFDRVTVNLIKASEEAGTLEVALRDVKTTNQKEMEFNDKVNSAMMYPAFVMLIFVGVMLMILVVVMPKISQVFTRLRVEMPIQTRIMIAMSDFLMKNTLTALAITGGIILLLYLLVKFQRERLFKVLFALPVVSSLVKQIDLTRFSRSLHLLLTSGLPIASALELAEEVVMRSDLRNLLKQAREQVMSGRKFAEGLANHRKLVPGMVVKLIEVGERSGTLDKSMKDISENLDYEVSKNLKTATALLEPLMLVGVGVAVGVMMMSIIGPIYGLISNVGR
jgi:type IV pilus assembly protein PilC